MSLLNMKPNRFLLSCFVFLTCLTTAFAQGTPSQDTAESELDFEALLAAIKQTDTPLKSGEGEVVHISGEPPLDIDPRIVTLIKVNGISKALTKQEFLKRCGQR